MLKSVHTVVREGRCRIRYAGQFTASKCSKGLTSCHAKNSKSVCTSKPKISDLENQGTGTHARARTSLKQCFKYNLESCVVKNDLPLFLSDVCVLNRQVVSSACLLPAFSKTPKKDLGSGTFICRPRSSNTVPRTNSIRGEVGHCSPLLGLEKVSNFSSQLTRRFHTSNTRSQDEQPDIKGKIFIVQTPWGRVANWWHLRQIQDVDPSFNMEEFEAGAQQATCVLAEKIARGEVQSLHGLLTGRGEDDVGELSRDFEEAGRPLSHLGFDESEVVMGKASEVRLVQNEEEGQHMSAAYMLLIFKYEQSQPTIMEFLVKFLRTFSEEKFTDWTIDGLKVTLRPLRS